MISNEELKDLKFMIENGFTYSQAAEVLGKSVVEVRKYGTVHQIHSTFTTREKDGLFFCRQCSTFKTREEFHKNKRSKHDIADYCKVCCREKNKLMHQKRKFAEIDAIIEKNQEPKKTKAEATGETKRECSVCGITKDINEFNWEKKNKRVRKQCKKCQAEYRKKWILKRIEERGY